MEQYINSLQTQEGLWCQERDIVQQSYWIWYTHETNSTN